MVSHRDLADQRVFLCVCVFHDVDLHRWQLSKTVKEDADGDIAKYDGLLLFSSSYSRCVWAFSSHHVFLMHDSIV